MSKVRGCPHRVYVGLRHGLCDHHGLFLFTEILCDIIPIVGFTFFSSPLFYQILILSDLPLSEIFVKPTADELKKRAKSNKDSLLDHVIDLDEVAIDSAPFQLVLGSSLYKVSVNQVHTLFSLLALSHAYVTDRGRLVGVIALKELRNALANIYIRGTVTLTSERKQTINDHSGQEAQND